MSVQLIVYPQSYNGQFNTLSSSPTELVVNGITFANLDNTGTYTSTAANPYLDTVTNAPPSIVNTWNRFKKGSIAFPTAVAGDLVLVGNSSEISGIYQELSNVTIGGQYTITINIPVAVVGGFVGVRVYSGAVLQGSSTTYSSNVTQINKTFFASATELTIMISYYNAASSNLTISNISTQPVIGAVPSGSTSILDDGQVICDLYEDEDLPLTLSVDDFKNVAEKVQSYSKAFNLPATKRNNQIFDQIFEITRSYDGVIFNPYKKTKCVLKQDGFVLFQGYLRLLDVSDKLGEVSFNVNLYSEVIALADFLGERTFQDLDLSELTHAYTYANIRESWQGNLVLTNPLSTDSFAYLPSLGVNNTNVLKYPFVDWSHQFSVGSTGFPTLPSLESAFRPFIKIKYLIDRIFEGTPFSYTSEFFDTTIAGGGAFDFGNLFMDFNWGGNSMPAAENTYLATWYFGLGATSNIGNGSFKEFRLIPETVAGGQAGSVVPPNYDTTTYIITAISDNEIYNVWFSFVLENTSDPQTSQQVEYQWLHNSTAINYHSNNIPYSSRTYNGYFQVILQTGDTLKAQFKGGPELRQHQSIKSTCTFVQSNFSVTSATLNTLRGETGQWDFLKGLITMFNLITIPDENNPNNIIIEPYVDVFVNTAGTTLANRSIQHDWTEKIDVSEMKLEPLTDLTRKTIFKFVEDDDDYAFNQYKRSVDGHLYGSKKYSAGNEFNILEGQDEIVAEPFAATVVKPLMSQFTDFIVPAIYAMNDDGVSEGFENSPRILYSIGVKTLNANTYNVPSQNCPSAVSCGNASEVEFLQFSHLTDIPTVVTSPPASTDTRDFHFGECQLITGVGAATTYNLFNMYWLPYYAELYNPNTRIMTIKVNLSPSDINTFKFNDTIFIKNRIFRCNRIDYKPNDLATVEFILIP